MKNAIVVCLVSIALSSCIVDDSCDDSIINTTSLEAEYGCSDTRYNLEVDLDDTYMIISNQNEFDQYVSGDCHPNIDFETYDLIIGKRLLSNGNDSIDYRFTYVCNSEKLHLTVIFKQNETLIAPNVTFHALIPKLRSGQEIMVGYFLD